ncbi:MAG: M13 family metallopeptidase [Alphaproteobacteria bacterium]|nr:M13 family metallopeptidase [Alphaproteobacteria bacterium]
MHRSLSAPSVALLLLASCGEKEPPEAAAVPAPQPDPVITEAVRAAMDLNADPCQDFYRYACGGWLDSTELPPDEPIRVRSFSDIRDRNEELLKGILESAAASPGEDATRQQVGAVYGACMNTEAVDAAGAAPLKPWLTELDAVTNLKGAMAYAGRLQRAYGSPLFGGEVYPDFQDPGLNILHIGQGGLGMPDRDYYLKEGDEAQAVRDAYVDHIAAMFELTGMKPGPARADAEAVFAFELQLAEVSKPRAALRDPVANYNKLDRQGLQALAPDFPWDPLFKALGGAEIQHINVGQPDFFTEMPKVVSKAKIKTLRAYLRWHTVDTFADALSQPFQDQNFAFNGKVITGSQELKPRWKRCVEYTQWAMGEALGQLYVEEAFPGDSKDIALELIHGIEDAFGDGLEDLSWMDEETRSRALAKRDTLVNKIGYPDTWRDYSALQVSPDDHFANVLATRSFEVDRNLRKIGGEVDRGEWFMPPQVVNAYYNPLNNEMVFPAGILQPPFFDRGYPAAMNFGAIGMVMGHELTHGFDDTGRMFGPDGKMAEWWDADAVSRFNERAQCVVDQYSGWEVNGTPVNGELTLGENIADLGGMKEAWTAWNSYVRANGPDAATVEGLSSQQLFFVAFAQTWCSKATPELEQLRLTVDTHAPPRYRVMGPLVNLPAFGDAFECEAGSPMRPEQTCEVW